MKQKQFTSIFLSIILIAVSISSFGQLINEKYRYNTSYIPVNSVTNHYTIWTSGAWHTFGDNTCKFNIENKISSKEVAFYKYSKKGQNVKRISRRINSFDKKGSLVDNKYIKKGKEKSHLLYEYNDDGYFTLYEEYKRTKLRTKELLKYNKYNDVLEYRNFNKGEAIMKWEAEYNDTILTKQYAYRLNKKDTSSIYKLWEYEYYPDNKKKATKYFKNGELKHTWSYTCDDEGEEIRSKDKTKICEVKQYNNDGTYVIINRSTGKKGQITKTRLTYDSKDRLIMREYIRKNKIYSKQSYKYDDKGRQIAWYYYKNGKKSDIVRWGREYVFNEDSTLQETRYISKGGAYAKRVNTFNDNGKRISSIYFDLKHNKQVYRNEYKYNEAGLIIEELKFNKKNFLVNKEVTIYQYYQ